MHTWHLTITSCYRSASSSSTHRSLLKAASSIEREEVEDPGTVAACQRTASSMKAATIQLLVVALLLMGRDRVVSSLASERYQSRMMSISDAPPTTTRFPHIHPDIVSILECSPSTSAGASVLLDPETLEILWTMPEPPPDKQRQAKPISTQLLVDLAYQSDKVLYQQQQQQSVPSCLESLSLQTLWKMGETSSDDEGNSKIVAATLLALNRLESAIRRSTGYTAGRAPLLKQMVTQLPDNETYLACILMALLMPHGLNLRNLLWHGFCASHFPRPWLALVLILTHNLEAKQLNENATLDDSTACDYTTLEQMTRKPTVRALLHDMRRDEESINMLKDWLAESHHDLLQLAFVWKDTNRPACSIALLSIILEHGLRLDWCRLNDKPESAVARPGSYYVTLDGHGQKHQHDLILYPYIGGEGDGDRENKLIGHLGGAVIALLTDLYASSCGGPNLRAALSHGIWDAQLDRELIQEPSSSTVENHDVFVDMANLVIAAMEGAALSPRPALQHYHPLFSFRAVTLRNLESVMNQLERLVSLRESSSMKASDIMTNYQLATLKVAGFDSVANRVLSAVRISNGEWTTTHVFREHGINSRLADLGAARTLLEDLAAATSAFVSTLEEAQSELQTQERELHRRRLKQIQRMWAVSETAITLYRFAALVALLSLDQALCDDECIDQAKRVPPSSDAILQAVKRSRMCVSTFSTFLTANTDRALKAAVDYTKGKAVKAVVEYYQ